MPADNYQTIFELGFRTFPWTAVGGPLIFIAAGFLLFRISSFFKRKTFYAAFGMIFASLATLIFLVSLMFFIPRFLTLRHAYVSGRSNVVSGAIQDFHQAPALGPASESFSVQGVLFSYNAVDDTPCFHDAPLHRGPIREGLNVRIHYDGDCIQKVEVSGR